MKMQRKTQLLLLVGFVYIHFTAEPSSRSESEKINKISPTDKNLQYTGRIDFDVPTEPIFHYSGSYITTRFSGTSLKASFSDHGDKIDYIGFIIDGGEMIKKSFDSTKTTVNVANELEDVVHDLIIVKCTGTNSGYVKFYGLELDEGRELIQPDPRPKRKIELLGNSITSGSNSEFTGPGEDRDPLFHNGWLAFGCLTARALGAEVHNVGIPGIGILAESSYTPKGAIDAFDKITPPWLPNVKNWNFKKFSPHVVILAYGTNDSSLSKNWKDKKENWNNAYKSIIENLLQRYQDAELVLCVPHMNSERKRIEKMVRKVAMSMHDRRVHYFDWKIPPSQDGHPNKTDHENMAKDLTDYIESIGISW